MRGQEEKKGKKGKKKPCLSISCSQYLDVPKKKGGIEEDKLERDQMSVSLDKTRVETTVGLMDNLI